MYCISESLLLRRAYDFKTFSLKRDLYFSNRSSRFEGEYVVRIIAKRLHSCTEKVVNAASDKVMLSLNASCHLLEGHTCGMPLYTTDTHVHPPSEELPKMSVLLSCVIISLENSIQPC